MNQRQKIGHPVFFMNDPHRYLSFVEELGSRSLLSKLTIPLTLGLEGNIVVKEPRKGVISRTLTNLAFSVSAIDNSSNNPHFGCREKLKRTPITFASYVTFRRAGYSLCGRSFGAYIASDHPQSYGLYGSSPF